MGALSRRNVVAGGLTLALAGHAPATLPDSVAAPAGTFVGERSGGVLGFRGIRYGRARRFLAPVAEPRASSPVRATEWGPSCPQGGSGQTDGAKPLVFDEDCLFLNVWTAEPRPGARKPVLFYIHGGAYSSGTGSSAMLDGSRLAACGDVVVVTINHRLNVFGYGYLARLDPRFADSGNAGQLDIHLALRWVRDNIAAFGGDPARVLVFGQSGGGAKIATMLGTPAARGLFQRAWTMSGQQVTASGPLHATERTRAFMAKLGVADAGTLATLPWQRLVEGLAATDPILGGGVYFGPVLDMKWLDRHPFWPDANPIGLRMPLVLGNTRDETRAFTPPRSPRMRDLNWDNIAERIAPDLRIDVLPEWVVAQYRARYPDWPVLDVFYAATTAGRSWRGQVIEAEERARAGAPAWVYQLDFGSRTDPLHGAFHTMDIPLTFGTLDAPGSETGTGADARAASQAMRESLVAFAKTGDPNHRGLPAWPRYDLAHRPTMLFDATSRVENDPRKWQRELFARIPYIQPGT